MGWIKLYILKTYQLARLILLTPLEHYANLSASNANKPSRISLSEVQDDNNPRYYRHLLLELQVPTVLMDVAKTAYIRPLSAAFLVSVILIRIIRPKIESRWNPTGRDRLLRPSWATFRMARSPAVVMIDK